MIILPDGKDIVSLENQDQENINYIPRKSQSFEPQQNLKETNLSRRRFNTTQSNKEIEELTSRQKIAK